MWKVKQILEADFGWEERMPEEPLTVLVYLENEDGQEMQLEVEDAWLTAQGIDEGDEWPDDLEEDNNEWAEKQMEWLDRYMDALEEINFHKPHPNRI